MEKSKNKTVAAILALLLGIFGAHKFYLGKVGWGVLYAIFCWTAIPALIGLVEGVMLLLMKQETFEARYCA